MAPHSSTLAWKIPRTEEPGRLQSMGSLRVGRDWATSLSLFTWCIGEGNGNPLQYSCLENPMDWGAWWATAHVVAESWTQLSEFSSLLGNEFMIRVTVRSWSCFCWLYRVYPSSAAKNIINLISVLTIWWCLCVESSLMLLEEGVCYDQCVLLAKLY